MLAMACQRHSDRRSATRLALGRWHLPTPEGLSADVQLIFPVAGPGRPRVRPIPYVKSQAAHAMLEGLKWRQVSWYRGTKGRLTARFAATRLRIADGAPQRVGAAGAEHMSGEEAWLVGEHPLER